MPKLHRPAAPVNPTPLNPPQMSAIAYREALRLLTRGQRAVYDYLQPWLMAQRRAGDRTGVFPSRKHISDQVGFCVSTVQRAITQFRALGLLAVIARRTTQHVWHRLHKQMTNLYELPSAASLARSISGLVSRRLRKKISSNRIKQEDEGSNEARRTLLRSQLQSILASGQDEGAG